MTRLLTIMGSGETAPTMVKVHRQVFERLAADGSAEPAVLLDTPFGFQENAPELSAKAVEYFRVSLQRSVTVAGLARPDALSSIEREAAFARIRQARFVFAGPGSPTYALRQWAGTPVPDLITDRLRPGGPGGAVTFASAAALTLGLRTVPVYEIYKSGADPYWLDGLDVLRAIELPVAVIPHYDNAEGGHHDTRFCYLGERRLRMLEAELPPGAFVLGVDEHTGVVLDLDADTATVVGLGVVTVRRDGVSTAIPSGETVPIDDLRRGPDPRSGRSASAVDDDPGSGTGARTAGIVAADTGTAGTETAGGARPTASLAADADRLGAAFDEAIDRRDAVAAAAAALDLEETIRVWSTDTLQSDEADRATALLRSMIVRLGDAAVGGLADPRAVLAPVVDVALTARRDVREAKRYDLSDRIRDGLAAAGIEVRDTPDGQLWDIRTDD
jgi:hypothetical protein